MLRCAPAARRTAAVRSPSYSTQARTIKTPPRAPPSRSLTPAIRALRSLSTRAAPPTSAGRPSPAGRAPPRSAAPPPPPQQPQGVYAGSDFVRKHDASAKPAAAASGPDVIELTQLNFEEMVLKSPVPVLVDVYADWCEPCHQLTPMLERLVRGSGGALRLGKLNADKNQDLCGQMKVEQLPTIYAFFQGKMIDGFVGMPDAKLLKTFFDKLLTLGGSSNAKPYLDEAAQLLESGDIAGAREVYQEVLKQVCLTLLIATLKSEARALAGLARCALAEKDIKAATELVTVIRKSYSESLEQTDVRQAVSSVDLSAGGSGGDKDVKELEAKVKANPADLESRYALASALFAAGTHARAIDEALDLLKRDRAWNEQAAKNLLLKIFEALGPSDPLTQKSRQRFTSILFM